MTQILLNATTLAVNMSLRRKHVTFWILLYLGVTAGLGWWLAQVRAHWLRQAERPESRAAWEAWKADVRSEEASGSGPVRRRVPAAEEPPSTILLRDHFPAIAGGAWLVWTAFFGFMAVTLTGALRRAASPVSPGPPRAPANQ